MKNGIKKVKTVTIIAAALAVMALSACGGGKNADAGESTATPPPPVTSGDETAVTETDKDTPVPAEPTATIEPTAEPTPTPEPTPEPTPTPPPKPDVTARGIYITGPMAGNERFNSRFELTQTTELNAMVVDVKSDEGVLSFSGFAALDDMELSENYIPDPEAFLKRLHDGGIYAIARVVCFKDNGVVNFRPELALHTDDGKLYREYGKSTGLAWLNPYNRDVWAYIGDVAEYAAGIGFDEIQLDYVRFPTDTMINHVTFTDEMTGGLSKEQVIAEFGAYVKGRLAGYPVLLSADIYGSPLYSDYDASLIGQNFIELLKVFDVLSPMLYPSHYAGGTFDIEYPDLEPYGIINETLKIAVEKRDKVLAETGYAARLRPWIQDFAAPWLPAQGLKYQLYWGPQVADQIRACEDNGIFEFLLWDPINDYDGYRDLVGQPY